MELLTLLKQQQHTSVIWTCLLKFNYSKNHPMNGHPGQRKYLTKNGRNIECNNDNRIPLVVPGVQATEHQTEVLDESPADVATLPTAILPCAHPQGKPTSNKAGGKHKLFTHFPKDLNCEKMQTNAPSLNPFVVFSQRGEQECSANVPSPLIFQSLVLVCLFVFLQQTNYPISQQIQGQQKSKISNSSPKKNKQTNN